MVHTPHLDLAYGRELNAVSAHVAKMADYAERMVRDAILALLSQDPVLAQQVRDADEALDAMEVACDLMCVRLMARRAPVGNDLRLVTATLKLVTDIERIGDLAVNIVKRSGDANPKGAVPPEVAELARVVVEELGHAFAALKQRDVALARKLRTEDKMTDDRNRQAFARLFQIMQQNGDQFSEVLALTNVCRHLERIGDHAVNIAEMVVYMVEGQVLRHHPDTV